MIVKVQNSLSATYEVRQILVYNKSRSIQQQFDAVGELRDLPLKSFWHAHIDKNKQLVLDKPAPWQEW